MTSAALRTVAEWGWIHECHDSANSETFRWRSIRLLGVWYSSMDRRRYRVVRGLLARARIAVVGRHYRRNPGGPDARASLGEGRLPVSRNGHWRGRVDRPYWKPFSSEGPVPPGVRRMGRSLRLCGVPVGRLPRLRGGALRVHRGARRHSDDRYARTGLRFWYAA